MPKNKTYHNKPSNASGKFDRKPLKPVFDTVIDFPPDVETERRRGAPDDDIFFHLLPGQLPCFRSHSINFPRVISRPTWDPIERRKTNWNMPARARNARKTVWEPQVRSQKWDTPAPYIRSGMKIAARGQQLNAGPDIGGRSNIPFFL